MCTCVGEKKKRNVVICERGRGEGVGRREITKRLRGPVSLLLVLDEKQTAPQRRRHEVGRHSLTFEGVVVWEARRGGLKRKAHK